MRGSSEGVGQVLFPLRRSLWVFAAVDRELFSLEIGGYGPMSLR